MRAVSDGGGGGAIERIWIRLRNGVRGITGVVRVARKIDAAFYPCCIWAEQRWIRQQGTRCCRSLVCGDGPRTAEVCMRIVDTRIDYGQLDAFTAKAWDARPHRGSLDARDADDIVTFVRVHNLDINNACYLAHAPARSRGNLHLDPVDGALERANDPAAGTLDLGHHRILLADALAPDCVFLVPRKLPADTLLYSGDGIACQNDNDGRQPVI